MYLEMCNNLEYVKDYFIAAFEPQKSNVEIDSEEVPIFLMLEGFAQIACRASSSNLFDQQPCFPAAIKKFEYLTTDIIKMDDSNLKLSASVKRCGEYGVSTCYLLDKNNAELALAEVWVTVRKK
ncbi:hypothetical protein [Anaeromicropila populeti]|uniref:3-hydroxymyristoyl/3-hydroxydecanoyl-(Acyl carrier protein) dehydratase n=1 Tax=Anaeromicropila populeti TaxID=37658 RepID=A0A1I6HSN5_9FIRM|nr:hypothetical protein [Anaeromicropila populeti]SFR57270.1 hypothetical protein SAMN05661086_00222 [Anaeromicropila populeti]